MSNRNEHASCATTSVRRVARRARLCVPLRELCCSIVPSLMV